jgi:hypothetical protein
MTRLYSGPQRPQTSRKIMSARRPYPAQWNSRVGRSQTLTHRPAAGAAGLLSCGISIVVWPFTAVRVSRLYDLAWSSRHAGGTGMHVRDSIHALQCPDHGTTYAPSTSEACGHLPCVDGAAPKGGVDHTPLPAAHHRDTVSAPMTPCLMRSSPALLIPHCVSHTDGHVDHQPCMKPSNRHEQVSA